MKRPPTYLGEPIFEVYDHDDVIERAERTLWPGSQDFVTVDEPDSFLSFVVNSDGPYVYDCDGTRYVDTFLGSGTVILGHQSAAATIYGDAQHRLPGPSASLRHPMEVILGERLGGLIPSADRVAYFKTGSEAVHMALRCALRKNAGDTVISVGYHGWLPPLTGDRLVSEDVTVVEPEPESDAVLRAVREHDSDLAAVLLGPEPGFLNPDCYRRVAALTEDAGGSVIMDEVKSGFRAAFPCLTAEFKIAPEFVVLGKAVANGSPLAVLCADETVFEGTDLPEFYSTFASERTSLASAIETIRALENGGFAEFEAASEHMYDILSDSTEYGEAAVSGSPTFFTPDSDIVPTTAVSEALLEEDVLFHPYGQLLVSAAHNRTDVLDPLSEAWHSAMKVDDRA